MSLFSTYTDANKLTTKMLCVRYSVTINDAGNVYTVTRRATKSYSYIGMTKETAENCRNAKIVQYTRTYVKLDSGEASSVPGTYEQTSCGANVTIRYDHDSAWRCDIDVNETDVVASSRAPTDFDVLFEQWAKSRNYDETTRDAIFRISSAAVNTSRDITHIICSWDQDFFDGASNLADIRALKVYYKATASATSWTQASGVDLPLVGDYLEVEGISTVGYIWKITGGGYSTNVVTSV